MVGMQWLYALSESPRPVVPWASNGGSPMMRLSGCPKIAPLSRRGRGAGGEGRPRRNSKVILGQPLMSVIYDFLLETIGTHEEIY